MDSTNQITPEQDIVCACGNVYQYFSSYKRHLIKQKCRPIDPETSKTPQNSATPTLENTNINSTTNQLPNKQSTQNNNGNIQSGNIAYKSASTNTNPKTMCNFCNKLYSKHNINLHRQRCPHRYKDSWQYKLLVRAGITDIPETYIEVVELFNKLNIETPQIFTNLPPSITQVDDITAEIRLNGRPKKPRPTTPQQPQTHIEQHIGQQIENQINNTTNNNNTNNTTNNITNNNQQNINIFLNPVCHESVTHITPERQMYIILQRLHAFKAFIDSVYEAPANHNVCITDRKGKEVKYLDKDHGINNGTVKNILGDIAMAHLGQIDNFIETHKDNIPEHRQNDLKFLDAFLLNENNNASVIKQLNDKVSVLSGSSKILLDKFQKQQAIDYINSLPEPGQEN